MVALRLEEDLRLMLEAAKGFGMDDAVYIPLKTGPDLARLFFDHAAAGLRGKHGSGIAEDPFGLLASFSRRRHISRLLRLKYWITTI
jgi:hypothetical protein